MNATHEPTPEFLRFLEWQTVTELRRADRFGPGTRTTSERAGRGPGRLVRAGRIAALVLVSLFSGAGVVLAAEHIQDSREQEIRIERNRVLLVLAEKRVDQARVAAERTEALVRSGVAPTSEAADARARMRDTERTRAQLELERAELEASGAAVDRRLWAPLVGPRDFVSESLRIDRNRCAERAESRAAAWKRAQVQVEAGMAPAGEALRAERDARAADSAVERIDERLELRADFVLGRVDARECERRDRAADAAHRGAALDEEMKLLRVELERARQLEKAGLAAGEAVELTARIDELEMERALVRFELELIEADGE